MKKAIEIVEAMIAKVNTELHEVQEKYKGTRPDSIYDASYRKVLEQMHDRLIAKSIVLEDVPCECGLIIDRDINAAINILQEGIRILQET